MAIETFPYDPTEILTDRYGRPLVVVRFRRASGRNQSRLHGLFESFGHLRSPVGVALPPI